MDKHWISSNKEHFIRDLIRDYCYVYCEIEEQQIRFSTSGTVSYSLIKELLEETFSLGPFSRLKDNAHGLFRLHYDKRIFGGNKNLSQLIDDKKVTRPTLDEQTLDWIIGYAFHECAKLKEDAYQQGYYLNKLLQLKSANNNTQTSISLPTIHDKTNLPLKNSPLLSQYSLRQKNTLWLLSHRSTTILPTLVNLSKQTIDNIEHALARILQILSQAQIILIHYLCKQKTNHPLARFLVMHENIIKRVFSSEYPHLLNSLYPESTDLRFILAAQDCLNGGRYEDTISILKTNNITHKYNALSLKLQEEAYTLLD